MAAVGGAALAGSLALAARHLDDRRIPLMGVMGAFVFAAQMVNFPIPLVPGTSGHLAGGLLLGILLGRPAALSSMASVLVVQALVFQDGGMEALGANIFNMGIVGCLFGAVVRQVWLKRGPGLLASSPDIRRGPGGRRGRRDVGRAHALVFRVASEQR